MFFKEGSKHFIVIEGDLWANHLFFHLTSINFHRLLISHVDWWRRKVVISEDTMGLLRSKYRWVESKLDSHLIVIWEDHHCILVTDHKVHKGCNQFPWLVFMRLEVDCYSIDVLHKTSEAIVRLQRELTE